MSPESPAPTLIATTPHERADARRTLDAAAQASGDVVSTDEAEMFALVGDRLDPRDEGDGVRILRQLWASRPPGPSLDAFLVRVAAEAPEPELRHGAALVRIQNVMFAGDVARADRLVHELLLESRGTGTRAERFVLLAVARISLQQRREFETLVLAGQVVRAMDAAGDAWGSLLARGTVCAVHSLLGDMERLSRALDDLEPRVRTMTDPVRRPYAERMYHVRRAEVLLSRGQYDAALGALRAFAYSGGRLYPGERRHALILEAEVHFARGQFARAADYLTTAARLGSPTDVRGLRIRARRLCLNVCRGVTTIVEDAETLLDDLEARGASDVGPATRRELAIQIGDAVGPAPAGLAVARRAYDLAATAAFERLVELDRFVRDVPESATPTADDLVVLDRLRRRTLSEQHETHSAIVRVITRATREGRSPAPMLPSDGELTCVCAWCQRVRMRDGVWLSIQQFLPLQLEGVIELTHGICDACLPSLRGQLGAETGAA